MTHDSPEVEDVLRRAEPLARTRLSARERGTEAFLAVLVLLGIAGLASLGEAGRHVEATELAVLVATFAVASRLHFNIGVIDVSATQLVLVPMLLLLPPVLVPTTVALGYIAERIPEYVRGTAHPDRVLLNVGDTAFVLVPTLLLAVVAPGPPQLEHAPLYLLALAAMMFADVAFTVLRAWLGCGVAPAVQLRLCAWGVAIDAALAPLGLLAAVVAATHVWAVVLVLPLVGLLTFLSRERDARIRGSLELSDAYRGTALLMGDVLEADDAYTGGEHTQGVVALALRVGQRLGLDAAQQRDLEFAALLHDIGKLRVPDAIINKPGALDPDEWEVIRRHPEDGQLMLERVGGVLADVGEFVRWHHERWDGGGYPDALSGDQIPLISRIVCACDAFSAMTTDRSYRPGRPPAEALAELEACSGSQFDPAVVRALVGAVGIAPAPPAVERLALAG